MAEVNFTSNPKEALLRLRLIERSKQARFKDAEWKASRRLTYKSLYNLMVIAASMDKDLVTVVLDDFRSKEEAKNAFDSITRIVPVLDRKGIDYTLEYNPTNIKLIVFLPNNKR